MRRAPRHPQIVIERALARTIRKLPSRVLVALSGRREPWLDGQRLDPQALILASLAERLRRPLDSYSPARARAEYAQSMLSVAPPLRRDVATTDRTLPGPAGPIPIRVYRPRGVVAPAPVLVYYHGGGWVIGDLDTHDPLCRILAEDGRCIVVSVDYRLGPEHTFPAGILDAIAAFRWVADNAASLGGDPARVAVGGDSAGGTLSAVVALSAREEGPMPRFQLLLYPACELAMTTPSHRTFAEGFLLTRSLMHWFQDHYLPNVADRRDWRASPLLAPDVAGVSPALILTAGYDPLRDEARAYADRLERAGVPVRYRCFEGLLHGFATMGGALDGAGDALAVATDALRAELGGRAS